MALDVRKAVRTAIKNIYSDGAVNKAVLAALRSANNILDHKAVVIWPIIFQSIQDKGFLSKNNQPSYAENAVFMALKCWSIYQQGTDATLLCADNDGSDKGEGSFFRKLGQLKKEDQLTDSTDSRVKSVLIGNSFGGICHSLVTLVEIFKSKDNTALIDFPSLGQDLYNYQFNSEAARQVAFKWGQQYYWHVFNIDNKEK